MIKVGDYSRVSGEIVKIEEVELPTKYSYGYAYYHKKDYDKSARFFIEFDIDSNGDFYTSIYKEKVTYSEDWKDLIEPGDLVNDKVITKIGLTTTSDELVSRMFYYNEGSKEKHFTKKQVNRLVTREYYQGGIFIDEDTINR